MREGLLSILSGLVTHVNRNEYPAPLLAQLVVALEFSEEEAKSAQEFNIAVRIEDAADGGSVLAEIDGRVGVNPGSEIDGEAYLPLVLNTSSVEVPKEGLYLIRITVEQADEVQLKFRARVVGDTPELPKS